MAAKDFMDEMLESNYIFIPNDPLNPSDADRLCRFRKDNPDHGHPPDRNKTWALVLKQAETNSYISLKGVTDFHEKCPFVTSMYLDAHNCRLYDVVRPIEWIDPAVTEPYDLVVVGGGAGGISAAIKATQLGFKVALIERSYIGGEHFNTGMIAFEALEECADLIQKLSESKIFGPEAAKESWPLSLKRVMEYMRLKRSEITPLFCNIFSLTDTYGIDVYLGNARFAGPQRLLVNDKVLDFGKCIVSVGSHPTAPRIEGLAAIPYYTIETIFNMTKKPASLVIYGSGQIACAYAQVFQRMQIEVWLICEENKLLSSEVMEGLNKYTESTLKDLGVRILTGATVRKIDVKKSDGKSPAPTTHSQPTEYVIQADVRGADNKIICQAILIATPKAVFWLQSDPYSRTWADWRWRRLGSTTTWKT